MNIEEVSTDYRDTNGFTFVDVYFTGNYEGCVAAYNGETYWKNDKLSDSSFVQSAIEEFISKKK